MRKMRDGTLHATMRSITINVSKHQFEFINE